MKSPRRIILHGIHFTGLNETTASVDFADGVNFIYGASNAGKSYTVKALDFMMGGKGPLPQITESSGYDDVVLHVNLPESGECSLSRAMVGGSFQMLYGADGTHGANNSRILSAKHDPSSEDNLSQLLLNECGFGARSIAKDTNGGQRSLSFRDISRFCIVDETSIQSETSPGETGQYLTVTSERSVLKLLLTGNDDSAVRPVENRKVFQTRTSAKLELLDEMLASLDEELVADYPDIEDLEDQAQRLEFTFTAMKRELEAGRDSIRLLLAEKHDIASEITTLTDRLAEIAINRARFHQLQNVYNSDIARLETIEEAGFLLLIGADRECPLCGAQPSAQAHGHAEDEIEIVKLASVAEIAKITQRATELEKTINQLDVEEFTATLTLAASQTKLSQIEEELRTRAPQVDEYNSKLEDLIAARDRVLRGQSLVARKAQTIRRRSEIASLKASTSGEKPKLGVSSPVAHDFAQMVSAVLGDWQFPGRRHVSFDEGTYDLKIDGKHRKDNGKGVRAITHAAFKVALLQFCRERHLPHPGFVVLDTPLLTYRDPLSRDGPLSPDEAAIANTSLKDFFFEHLASLKGLGQFLIFENVNPPLNQSYIDKTHVFTGTASAGRRGLF